VFGIEHEVDVVELGLRSFRDDSRLLFLRSTLECVTHPQQSGGDDGAGGAASEPVDRSLPILAIRAVALVVILVRVVGLPDLVVVGHATHVTSGGA